MGCSGLWGWGGGHRECGDPGAGATTDLASQDVPNCLEEEAEGRQWWAGLGVWAVLGESAGLSGPWLPMWDVGELDEAGDSEVRADARVFVDEGLWDAWPSMAPRVALGTLIWLSSWQVPTAY